MDPEELQQQLVGTLADVDQQIHEIRQASNAMGIHPTQMRDPLGNWPFASLLGTKAQLLHALAILETEGDIGPG